MTTDRPGSGGSAAPEYVDDPLGPATRLTMPLPAAVPYSIEAPIEAAERAGLTAVTVLFVDRPTCDETRWPAADRAFLDSLRSWERAGHVDPIVWCRIATAPNPVVVNSSLMPGREVGGTGPVRDPAWPADFAGVDRGRLDDNLASASRPGEVLQHIPSADGWHRIAWIRTTTNEGRSRLQLLCECDLQGVIWADRVGRSTFNHEDCAYLRIAPYMRSLAIRPWVGGATAAAFRPLLARAHAGDWIGQFRGDQMWGSNLYVETVASILGIPMQDIWPIVDEVVADGLIGLEGEVLNLPAEPPTPLSAGVPVIRWGNTESPDDRVVWWTRLGGRFQVEVVREPGSGAILTVYDHDTGDKPIGSVPVYAAFGARFGPDISDVDEWRRVIEIIVAEYCGT